MTLLWFVCATCVAWEHMSSRVYWPMGEEAMENRYTQYLLDLGWVHLMVSGCSRMLLHPQKEILDKPSLKGIFLLLRSRPVPCPSPSRTALTASFRWFIDEKLKLWSFFTPGRLSLKPVVTTVMKIMRGFDFNAEKWIIMAAILYLNFGQI